MKTHDTQVCGFFFLGQKYNVNFNGIMMLLCLVSAKHS